MRVPKGVFKIGKLCATADDAVPEHKAIFVRRATDKKCTAATTDGRSAVRVTWNDDGKEKLVGFEKHEEHVKGFSVLIPSPDARHADAAIDPDSNCPYVIVDESSANGTIEMIAASALASVRVETHSLTGMFPPIDDVIPDYKDSDLKKGRAVRVAIDGKRMIALIQSVMAAAPRDRNGIVLFVPSDPKRPLKVQSTKGDESVADAVGVLMPIEAE